MCYCCFFLLKEKTAYELRISDWSSDVCSSDLWDVARSCAGDRAEIGIAQLERHRAAERAVAIDAFPGGIGDIFERGVERVAIAEIVEKGAFGANRLGRTIGVYGAESDESRVCKRGYIWVAMGGRRTLTKK